jgi:hypothetical protein
MQWENQMESYREIFSFDKFREMNRRIRELEQTLEHI